MIAANFQILCCKYCAPEKINTEIRRINPIKNTIAVGFEMAPLANGLLLFSGCFLSDSISE